MADSVLRLRVENKEFDDGVKSATKGLKALVNNMYELSGKFTSATKAQVEYVRSMGKMETESTSARGRLTELTKAYKELQYQMQQAGPGQKSSELFKAMEMAAQDLKPRIEEARKELERTGTSSKQTGSALDALASKFGINKQQLVGWGAALGAGKVALDVMKQAFFASEENLDAWNRAVYAGQSTWEAFLTSINTGDISGFLGKIDSIVSAAKDAYNELDRLSTQKAINNKAYQTQNAENERMRAMLRTGRYIAPTDGRTASMKNGEKLTKEQMEGIARQLEGGLQKIRQITVSEIEQTTKSINALYNQQAKGLGMSQKEFQAGTSSMSAFDERMEGYRRYKQFEAEHTTSTVINSSAGSYVQSSRDNAVNPYEQYKAWGTFKDDGELFGKINELINQRSALQVQDINAQAQAFRAINKAEGGSGSEVTVKVKAEKDDKSWQDALQLDIPGYALGNAANGEKYVIPLGIQPTLPEGSMEELADQLKSPLVAMEEELARLQEAMHNAFDPEEYKGLSDMADKLKEKIDSFTGKAKKTASVGDDVAEAWNNATTNIGKIGQALSSIEDPTAKVAGIVAEAIATIAGTFAASLKGTFTPWDWIAGAAAGTATMIATIDSIKSATEYHADGGMVGMPDFKPKGTDTIPAMLTPGEIVLSAANQNMLAQNLTGIANSNNNSGRDDVRTVVTAEQIITIVNNRLRRIGKEAIL